MREHPQHDSPQEYRGGYEQDASTEGAASPGTLTVSVRIGGSEARYAAPSADQKKDFVYAALLYPDGGSPSENFVAGASDAGGSTITFLFQKPPLADGERLTLEIFAFASGTAEIGFSRESALLSGMRGGLEADGASMKVEALYLEQNASATNQKGKVSLKVKVPDGCALEIDDMANFRLSGTSPDYTIGGQNGEPIQAKSYPLKLTLKKGGRTVSIVSDHINVLPDRLTDTWLGLPPGEVDADGARLLSEAACDTLYVRGAGGWYDTADPGKTDYAADDGNMGSFLSPLETIHAAIEKTKDLNDGVTEYTIYVDGSFSLGAAADISGFTKNLTMKALSEKATLDAGGNSRVMDIGQGADANLDLTLERLVLTGGNGSGGVQISGGKVFLKDCEVKGNAGTGVSMLNGSASALTMSGGEISGNNTAGAGGGVYVGTGCDFTMESGSISGNEAVKYGGGVYVYDGGLFKIKGGSVNGNTASGMSYGGGVYIASNGEFKMQDGEICENECGPQSYGSGVYIDKNGKFTMNGGKINKNSAYPQYAGSYTVYDYGEFIMNGGEICENQAYYSAGVGINGDGTFEMTDGKISENISVKDGNGGGVNASGKSFIMSGGEISKNTACSNGGGVYIYGEFTMSGGKIINNKSGDDGGGIILLKGTFTMTGGEISGNLADGDGDGIYVYNYNSPTFIMKGNARVAEDNDVYLDLGYYSSESRVCKIQVDGTLTAASPVATITPSDRFGGRQILEAVNGTITPTVCKQFALTSQSGHEDDEILPDSTGAYGVLKCTSYYVRSPNSSPWYSANCSSASTGNDDHGGSLLNPFRTVQKAIDTISSANDGASEYTIYVDGTFYSSSATIADFNSVTTPLKVKIVGLDNNAQFIGSSSFQPIVAGTSGASKDVSLTLENLKLRRATNSIGRGGAITLYTTANNSHTIRNCEISECTAGYGSAIYNEGGSLHLENCTIHDNTTTTSGVIYNGQSSAILTMSDVTFENNTTSNGVIFIANDATVKVSDSSVVIKDNTFTDTSATAGARSTGICVWNGKADLSGSAKIDDGIGLIYESASQNRYVLVSDALTQSPVTTITPVASLYTAGTEVLVAGAGVTIDDDICERFIIAPESDGTEWKIVKNADGSAGVLQPK